jgi:hypothetical protein
MSKKADFEKLKAKWYKKLKDDGFVDIEYDDKLFVGVPTSVLGKRLKDGVWQAKAAYYSMAESFLIEYAFSNELDKIIWDYHANGISVREIAETLRKAKIKKTNRTTVWLTVKRLEKIMKQMYLLDFREENVQ